MKCCHSFFSFAITGILVDSLPDWSLRVEVNGLLVVDGNGVIVFRGENTATNVSEAVEK
jgi:hypothetical protein